ncbi:MAG: DUF2207 domain-containing protein [Hyphomonadaceae bacterium]|nr:DUF2207 domain-containing protein [Hyphomonadaceae bacterium]
MKALFFALIALLFAAPAYAAEQINRFDVVIDVETDGDIFVTENINVTAEGNAIRRGIFRDLPRYYEREGERLPYEYEIESVERDGQSEPYDTTQEGNAFRIRIGEEDTFLDYGPHAYVIRYRVNNQVRYFADYDEIYWNATGNYWAFSIVRASATVNLPPGARITATQGYTGALGKTGDAYRYVQRGDAHIFETTRPLQMGEGLTIAVGFAKGLIDPPSSADEGALLWHRFGALAVLFGSVGALFFFLYRGWTRVGRDPTKGPIFPRYEAPAGYSPAAVHYIYNRALVGHRALIATFMNLAVKGRINIDATSKRETILMRSPEQNAAGLANEDLSLERSLFAASSTKTLGGDYDPGFTTAYTAFKSALGRNYGSAYFRWNAAYTIIALVLSIVIVIIAANVTVNWTIWHSLGVVALAGLNIAFMYFMPAPTVKGQQVRSEIEGFKLYLETAEKLQLNAVQVGSAEPPPMTKERYEAFLPYAVALDVERPWTKYFEHTLPEVARAYSPTWTNMSTGQSIGSLGSSLVNNISSGVSSALPQSSSSSGSGGGGSSGGGGGGGGGGGW